MLNNKFFFDNKVISKKEYIKNINKTKVLLNKLKFEIKNETDPLLQSYEKKYIFDFEKVLIKKFSKYKNIIIIGMGGAVLGTKTIYSYLRNKIKKKVFFFDNLDFNLHLEFKKIKDLKNSCLIIVSKSGNTLETITNANLILSKNLFKNKLVIITEIKNSNLLNLGKKYNAEIIEHKNFISGRYSVLSEVGMFPAALMNLDIHKFKNLNKLIKSKNFTNPLIDSVSSIYSLYKKKKITSIILNYDTKLNDLCLWHQQLVGESLGKKGKGIMPIISTCPKDHHSLFQLYLDGPKDKFFTFFNSTFKKNDKVNLTINAQYKAAKKVFRKNKIPYRDIILKNNSEAEIGSIFTFLALETLLLSRLIKVNPYDQPAVEQLKVETKKVLN